jgi:hypothetical protein
MATCNIIRQFPLSKCDPCSIPGSDMGYVSPAQRPHRLWSPPRLLFNGYRGLYPQIMKLPDREFDNSSPYNADI